MIRGKLPDMRLEDLGVIGNCQFSALVDRRLDGEVFKYSAKIYAAATDLGQPAGVRSTIAENFKK